MGRVTLATLAISSMLILASAIMAQDAQTQRSGAGPEVPGHSNLDAELLDGLSIEPPRSGSDTSSQQGKSGDDARSRAADDASDPLTRGSDVGSQNPLMRIGGQMRQVEQRLAAQDVSQGTQQRQQQIVSELDQLIAALADRQQESQKQRKSRASEEGEQQSSQSATEAAKDSQGQVGREPAEAEISAAMREAVSEVWGHLPERFRRQMQSAGAVEFLPPYRKLIEDYYKRLAEERGTRQ